MRILLLFTAVVVNVSCHAQSPANENTLTIMTWNLEWFYDDQQGDNYSKLAKEKASPSRDEWDWRRDAFAKRIAQVRPSVLAVQEVENRHVLWYLARALVRNHQLEYRELAIESRDFFTEQDVGLMIRPPVDVVSVTQRGYPKRMRSSKRYYDVTKHIIAELEFQHGDHYESVLVMNLHLRSRAEGETLRLRQARLAHGWIADAVRAGKNVIVLGDFNTEERGNATRPESDMGIACGLETPDTSDDLVDLNLRLPMDGRQTHLLEGRQFDRILCSRSLLEDDPARPDLVFDKIEVLPNLSIQGQQDTQEEHWDGYWEMPQRERDLSDHYPVMATFRVQ